MQELPDACGVYLFKKKEKVLYVGKALSMKKRIASHRQSKDPKIQALLSLSDDVEPILCDDEVEALILENSLVKKHEPPFNMRLKDDTSYPYIKITDEPFPRVLVVRDAVRKGGSYFGPYTDVSAARDALTSVRRIFPFRTTKRKITGKDRPCLNYHLRLCPAPCAGRIPEEEYRRTIDGVRAFLEGRFDELERRLAEDMDKAAEALDFECARILRDRLFSIRATLKTQKISDLSQTDRDLVGMASSQDMVGFAILSVRGGAMNDARKFVTRRGMGTDVEMLESFLKQYYENSSIPGEILVPQPILDESIGAWLAQKSGKSVRLHAPQKGKMKKFLDMAVRNASLALSQKTSPLSELRRILSLPRDPSLIEAFDVSHIFGKQAVGSMVVFENGSPKKSAYRRFRVRTEGIDDVAMIAEIVGRRYAHAENPPDLVVVDGGVGQLNAAARAMGEKNMALPLIGLAKKNEEIYVPKRKNPIVLRRDSYALRLLQAIRDEAHRFALAYHSKLASRGASISALDEIPGIGEERKKKLLVRFKSVEGLRNATIDEIAAVIRNRKVAALIHERVAGQ